MCLDREREGLVCFPILALEINIRSILHSDLGRYTYLYITCFHNHWAFQNKPLLVKSNRTGFFSLLHLETHHHCCQIHSYNTLIIKIIIINLSLRSYGLVQKGFRALTTHAFYLVVVVVIQDCIVDIRFVYIYGSRYNR